MTKPSGLVSGSKRLTALRREAVKLSAPLATSSPRSEIVELLEISPGLVIASIDGSVAFDRAEHEWVRKVVRIKTKVDLNECILSLPRREKVKTKDVELEIG